MDTLCLLTQPKEGQQQFKNKKHPELTENHTLWKSNNQGDKEETFIQIGRRGRDGQPGQRGPVARRQLERTQQGGRLWHRAGCMAASRPQAPHSCIDEPGGMARE